MYCDIFKEDFNDISSYFIENKDWFLWRKTLMNKTYVTFNTSDAIYTLNT